MVTPVVCGREDEERKKKKRKKKKAPVGALEKLQFPSVVPARHVTGEVKVFSGSAQIECPERRLRFPRCQGSCEVGPLLPFQVKMIKARAALGTGSSQNIQ